jgi:hypothetical protein
VWSEEGSVKVDGVLDVSGLEVVRRDSMVKLEW